MSDDGLGKGPPPSTGAGPGDDQNEHASSSAEQPGHYVPRHARRPEAGTTATTGRLWSHRLLIGVNVAVALTIVLSALGAGYAVWRLNQIGRIHLSAEIPVSRDPQSRVKVAPPPPGKKAPPPLPAETFLIVGSDTRAGLNQPGDKSFGSASAVSGARSDTIMLARVVPATKQIALLSIPRDTYFDIPPLGMQKINAALGVSPNLLIRTIETKYGIDINHYIDVDFDSFKDIADALGGVNIYFPTPVRDVNAGLYIGGPGCVNLTGNLALAFVRSREYTYRLPGQGWQQEAESDLARIERQQMFIRKLAAKAQSQGLGNPITLDQIIGGLTKNLTVDDSLSDQQLVNLAATFRNINPANIVGWTMPATPETLQTPSGPNDVLIPQRGADRAMVAQFLSFGAKAPAAVPTRAPTSVATTAAATTTTTTTTVAPTSTSKPTATTTSSTVPTSTIQITVINGSGISGQAGRTGSALSSVGFDVVGLQNATAYGQTSTVVQYGPDGLAAADTVAAYLRGPVSLEVSDGLGPTSIQVLTGTRTRVGTVPHPPRTSGSNGSASTTSTSSSTSTSTTVPPTSTTVPPTTSTTYSLPGTPKSGAPSCPN